MGVAKVFDDDIPGFTSTNMASGAVRGVADLTEDSVVALRCCVPMAEFRLLQLLEIIREDWPEALPWPDATVRSLQNQVCAWVSHGYPTKSIDYHTLSAAVLLR